MPHAITIVTFVLGLVLMVLWWLRSPAFFRLRPVAFAEPAVVPPAGTPV